VGFEGVEVLAAAVGGVEVGGAAVLSAGMVQPLDR